MKRTSVSALVASAVVGLTALSAANAAPFRQGSAAEGNSSVMPVDLRPYSHCHWINGRRLCHGPHYEYYDDYGYEQFEFPFFLPFFWSDRPEFRYYGDRRDFGRRDYGGRDYGRRDGGRDGRRDGRSDGRRDRR
jgi:hypothetical protein